MPGPSGQDCSCPLDITPVRDGPAHEYPDDGDIARANRTSQYILYLYNDNVLMMGKLL